MKNFNGKLDLWVWCVVLLCFPLLMGCPPDPPPKLPPLLVIIGEDLSQTFNKFTQITEVEVREICESISVPGSGGGTIVLMGIGSSTPKGYITCKLNGVPFLDESLPPAKRLKERQKIEKLIESNQEKIETFLINVSGLLKARNQAFTDINGFFQKAATISDSPSYENYQKWLYINSDGKHDTKEGKKLDCGLKPSNIDHYSISGWQAKENCSPDARFLSPEEFVNYFSEELANAIRVSPK